MLLKHGAVVHNELPDNLKIHGNYSLVYAVFRNLIENSVRYAGEQVEMHLQLLNEDDTHYYLRFYENGSGIEPQYLPRIFERFFRAEKGRTRQSSDFGGTGLGLSIVRNAILFHHGKITANNREEGGLQYDFTLAK